MLKKGEEEKEGVVIENLPNTTFRVEAADGRQYLCSLSGKMRMYRIRILPGDRVKFVTTPYDPTRGRIVYRLK
ncbi:MAG TPA: translation initiation factor IF-1 [Clostridia bacterium]|nr:translation initiation factor IF-1 [Clostridia bacterium]